MTQNELKERLQNLFATNKHFKNWRLYEREEGGLCVFYLDEDNEESPPMVMSTDGTMNIECDFGEIGNFILTPALMLGLVSVYKD